ncbi:MAG: membrane protein insertase YidC [Candidatus Acidiferrales bacterium]
MKELSDEKRMLVAFVLMIFVLFIWGRVYKPPVVQPPAKNATAAETGAAASSAGTAATAGNSAAGTMAARTELPTGAVEASAEKTIVVESPLYRVELSNRGAAVRSWKLKKYLNDSKPPTPLELVNEEAAQEFGEWPLSLSLDDAQLETQANSGLYQVKAAQLRVNPPTPTPQLTDEKEFDAPVEITFHWSDGHIDVVKTLKFGDDYQVEVETTASVDGKPLAAGIGWRGGFGDVQAAQESQLVNVFYREGGKLVLLPLKKLGAPSHPEVKTMQAGTLEYAGIEDQFFTAAFLPNGPGVNLWDWAQQHNYLDDGKPAQESESQIAVGSAMPGPLSMRLYVGPKDIHILANLKPPLEELVQFGYVTILAKPLLEILLWTHKYIPNYGWAIVFITLAINTALFPLKMKSWRSMQKMQKVGPEVKSIQDRYKKYSMNDPRKKKMNEEVMAIYSREGVNPFGSCLPMLVQFPIWAALYRMLGGAIELRHAPWFGWLHDLSARDPYYILPVLMVVTMYLMQKMTPTTTVDPAQQKMMTFMPILMGVFFFRLSSGLILYIFTSNLVGMGQQYYLNRTEPLPAKGRSNNGKKT